MGPSGRIPMAGLMAMAMLGGMPVDEAIPRPMMRAQHPEPPRLSDLERSRASRRRAKRRDAKRARKRQR